MPESTGSITVPRASSARETRNFVEFDAKRLAAWRQRQRERKRGWGGEWSKRMRNPEHVAPSKCVTQRYGSKRDKAHLFAEITRH